MKPSDRHPMRWVGLPVFKLAVDRYGRETQIRGKVMSYCPTSTKYLLLYTDGSSDDVPVDEIEDHVPFLLQLPVKKQSAKKRRAEDWSEELPEPRTPTVKRTKVSVPKTTVARPEAACARDDKQEVMSRFVQDTLWALTSVLNVSDEKQRTLLATLNNRNEQPLAALASYAEEGGIDALSQTLQSCACRGRDDRGEACHTAKRAYPLPTRSSSGESTSRWTTIRTSSPRVSSRCDQHLRELISGNGGGVFSPKPTQPKEQHAPCKREPIAHNFAADSPPTKTPVVVDLTSDFSSDEEEEAIDETYSARTRLYFGLNSTVLFDKRESVDVFRLQMRRIRLKQAKLPKQNPEIWKSALKSRPQRESKSWEPDRM